MTVTVVDGVDNSQVASTTVPINSDITSWLNSLTIPTHSGYVFDHYEITAGTIENVADNATVYLRYVESGGVEPTASAYVNGDGDITVSISNLSLEQKSAEVEINMTTGYSNYASYDVYELNDGMEAEQKVDADLNNDGKLVDFTDNDISTHDRYKIGLYDGSGNRLGQTAWESGYKPVSIKFKDGMTIIKELTITCN